MSAGYVYVFGGKGLYKIGRAKDPESRVRAFTLLPFACKLVLTIESEDAGALERHLHQHYSAARVNGEWFKLSKADLKAIPAVARECALMPPAPARKSALRPTEVQGPVRPVWNPIDDRYVIRLDIDAMLEELTVKTGHRLTYQQIERAAGLPTGTFARWADPKARQPRSSTLWRLLDFLRSRGCPVELAQYYRFEQRTQSQAQTGAKEGKGGAAESAALGHEEQRSP